MIETRSLRTEQELAEEFVSSFAGRHLAEKFFYWFPMSVRAWLALCSDGEYRNYVRSRSMISSWAAEIASFVGPQPVEVMSLGSGQGDKDLVLLRALKNRGEVSYTPVDTSLTLLELACGAAQREGFSASGIKADFTTQLDAVLKREGEHPRLVVMIGNTLGAFNPSELALQVRALLREGDTFLVDGEIYADGQTLSGYDNPLNRRFVWAPLHSVGLDESVGEIVFETATDGPRRGFYRLVKHFVAGKDTDVFVGGESMHLQAGEKIVMGHSYKYDLAAFKQMLKDVGLQRVWGSVSEDERFTMALCRGS